MVGVPQKVLSLRVDIERRRRLMEGLGEEEVQERARLMSLGLPQAGSWLTVAPILTLGLHMRPQEFVLAARLRLGMAVYSEAGPCSACRQHSNVLGVHAMNCGSGGERISRHHHLKNHLHEVAVAAGLGPAKEARFLIPVEDSRPADVFIPQFAAGLNAAHQRKMRGWGEGAVRVVRRLARHTGQEKDVLRHQWGSLAISLQRGYPREQDPHLPWPGHRWPALRVKLEH